MTLLLPLTLKPPKLTNPDILASPKTSKLLVA